MSVLIITISQLRYNFFFFFRYDLVITELLASSCDAYISHYLKVPQIAIVSSHIHTWYHDTFGSHMNPAHVSTFHAPFATPTNFMQRLSNVYDYLYSHVVFKFVDREATAIGRKYFGPDVPDADTLMKNTSLLFVNGHFSVDLSRPLLPNFVNIAGIHLVPPKPLPQVVHKIAFYVRITLRNSFFVRILNTYSIDLQMERYTSHLGLL